MKEVRIPFEPDEVDALVEALAETRNAVTDVLVRQKDPRKVARYTAALVALGRIARAMAAARNA